MWEKGRKSRESEIKAGGDIAAAAPAGCGQLAARCEDPPLQVRAALGCPAPLDSHKHTQTVAHPPSCQPTHVDVSVTIHYYYTLDAINKIR